MKKQFVGKSWLECVSKVRLFIDKYNLEFINLNVKQQEDFYIAKLEYGLGVVRWVIIHNLIFIVNKWLN